MQYEYADNLRSTSELSEYRRERAEKANKRDKTKSGDAFFSVVITQLVVFTLIGLVIFGFYKAKSETFTELKTVYNTIMQKDYSVNQIKDAVKTAVNFIAQPKSSDASAPVENTTAQPSVNADPGSDLSENEDLIYGSGGEDLMYATDNTNFSPFFLSVPMVKPVEYKKITSEFGYRINPITNEFGFHTGIDLAAPKGTDIKAAFDGVVAEVKTTNGKGKQIVIATNDSLKTCYCHCDEIIAEKGAVVKAGEVIAKVGTTGQSTGPHLHFEVIINGIYYNPKWALES